MPMLAVIETGECAGSGSSIGRDEHPQDAIRHAFGRNAVDGVDQHHELVAAEPTDRVAVAQHAAAVARAIWRSTSSARLVAVDIVDLLEAVDVHEQRA